MTALLLLVIRLLLAWVFLPAGVDVLRNPEPRAATAGWLLDTLRGIFPFLPADSVLVVRANAAVQILAAALLVLDWQPRLAALTLAASLVPTTLGGHAFWRHDDAARRQQQVHFNKNLAILGGLLAVATFDRPGQRKRSW